MTREQELKQPYLDSIQPDFDKAESYQHGFHDAIQVIKDNLQNVIKDTDPEIMKQAGWGREEPFKGFTVADMKRAMEFAAIKGWNLELGVSAKFREREKMIENYIKSIVVVP